MNIKKAIAFCIIGIALCSAPIVFAQTKINISSAIPGQNANTTSTSPGAFVANFYQFALLISGLLAFAIIVYGGIKYMTSAGNPSGQSDAKEWIQAALLGMLLLASAYLILKTINPQLLNLNLPGLNGVNINLPTSNTGIVGTTGGTGGSCRAPTVGDCTVANLQNTCLSANAATFAGICGKESGGNAAAKSGTDYCTGPNGQKESVSIGLFQVNITNSWKQTVIADGKQQNCSAAFSGQAISCSGKGPCTTGHNGTGQQCQVTNMDLYNACVTAAQNVVSNINDACQLTQNGGLGPWKADAGSCY